ncbi:MAG: hypothetical protein ACP5PS_06360 [Bacteroidales bacterium]
MGAKPIAWREYDGGKNEQKVDMNANIITKIQYDSTLTETVLYTTTLSVTVDNNDEFLGKYLVTWWTENNKLVIGGDFAVWHSFR